MQEDQLNRAEDRGRVVDRGDAAIGVPQGSLEAEQMSGAVAVEREAGGGDRGGAHRAEIEQFARLHQALMVAQHHLDRGAEIMAERRGLGRLAMGIGDDQRRLFALGQHQRGGDGGAQLLAEPVEPRLQCQLEQGVVDIVARAAGVQAAIVVRLQALAQFGLDQEEIILDLAGIDQCRRVDLALDREQSAGDARGRFPRENAGFRQHDEMGAVDGAEALDMMRLRPVEERAQHRLLVDRIGKDGGVAGAWIDGGGHRTYPFSPASTTPRTM